MNCYQRMVAWCEKLGPARAYYTKLHPEPKMKGWRWLKAGEWIRPGDEGFDPRSGKRVVVIASMKMTANHVPYRTKRGVGSR